MDEVLHRARGKRADRRHRARADDVRIDARRAACVRAPKVVLAIHGDLGGSGPDETLEHLLPRERRISIQLGREHLDPRARRAQADLAVDCRERAQQTLRVRSTGRAGHAEEDSHGSQAIGLQRPCGRAAGAFRDLRAARAGASRFSPRARPSLRLSCCQGPWKQPGTPRATRGCRLRGTNTSP